MKLRKAHYEQMLAYINHSHWYYGPRKQFEKREMEIKQWLDEQIESFIVKDLDKMKGIE